MYAIPTYPTLDYGDAMKIENELLDELIEAENKLRRAFSGEDTEAEADEREEQ